MTGVQIHMLGVSRYHSVNLRSSHGNTCWCPTVSGNRWFQSTYVLMQKNLINCLLRFSDSDPTRSLILFTEEAELVLP